MRRIGPEKLPDAARVLVPKGERVLSWARDARGDVVIATLHAVYVPVRDGEHERIPYERISAATWEDPMLEISLVGGRGRKIRANLEEPGELPPTVRERVTASIALSEHVALIGPAGARITARRAPGSTEVSWNVVFDSGLDARDPFLQARADAAIVELKGVTGL